MYTAQGPLRETLRGRNHHHQRQGQKPACRPVYLFGEPQQQSKIEPYKQDAQEGYVVKGDMGGVEVHGDKYREDFRKMGCL